MFGVYRHLQPANPALNASTSEIRSFYRGVWDAGCISGIAVTVFQNPLDVWRTRLQTTVKVLPSSKSAVPPAPIHLTPSTPPLPSTTSRTTSNSRFPTHSQDTGTLISLLKQRKLLWRGMSMTIIRNVPGNGVYFMAFEWLKRVCDANQGFGLSASTQQLLCGGLTGLMFHVPFYPTEVVRTRMMISNQGGAFQVAREIKQTLGISGFYRGVGVVMLKSFPVTAMGFWSIYVTESFLGLN